MPFHNRIHSIVDVEIPQQQLGGGTKGEAWWNVQPVCRLTAKLSPF